MKALVILREGKGDHAAVKAVLRREFKAAGISYEIKEARSKKQAEKFVHKHAKDFDHVVECRSPLQPEGTIQGHAVNLSGTCNFNDAA